MASPARKPLHFVASSRKDLQELPEPVQDAFGYALLDAQYGDHPDGARPFGEGLPREVMKLVEDFDGNTFRAAYTVAFPRAVYVLHVFKKEVGVRNCDAQAGQGRDQDPAANRGRALPEDV